MLWSVVGLAGTVTTGLAPETNGDKSLGDAEDSGILKIHLSDSGIKVPILYKWSKLCVYTVQRLGMHAAQYLESFLLWLRERGEEFSISNHTYSEQRNPIIERILKLFYLFIYLDLC